MNAIVKSEPQQKKLMLLEYMADKYALKPDEFGKTVRATCGLATATAEQVAAFLIVAKEYDLNPLTKEIYAFPGRSGGIVPIVSVDGWVNLVNSHPQCDGFKFTAEFDEKGKLFSYTCTMHRKDRKVPTEVTEYLSECKRATEPWKMEHRMLRHKSLIQAARYAFGFAGIYDEDEGRLIADSGELTAPPPRDSGPPSEIKVIEHKANETVVEHADTTESVVTEEPEVNESATAPEPHELVPEPGKTNSFEGWATAYMALIETSPDKAALLKWADVNLKRLETLKKNPEWSWKVSKATKAIYARLHNADPISSGPQPSLLDDMGGDTPPPTGKRTSGAVKGKKAPDIAKDYDGWIKWNLEAVAEAETPEAIEALYETIDASWDDLFPPDREAFMAARREAEGRMEQ